MFVPRRDGNRVSQARECQRNEAVEIRLDGRENGRRRWLSRLAGWQTSGDFRIQELDTGAVDTLFAATTGDGDCSENAGAISVKLCEPPVVTTKTFTTGNTGVSQRILGTPLICYGDLWPSNAACTLLCLRL